MKSFGKHCSLQAYNNINMRVLNYRIYVNEPTRPSENRNKKWMNDLTFRYLSIGEKCIFINEISVAGATASNVPEIIISTTQVLRNFARIPARKMS